MSDEKLPLDKKGNWDRSLCVPAWVSKNTSRENASGDFDGRLATKLSPPLVCVSVSHFPSGEHLLNAKSEGDTITERSLRGK